MRGRGGREREREGGREGGGESEREGGEGGREGGRERGRGEGERSQLKSGKTYNDSCAQLIRSTCLKHHLQSVAMETSAHYL